MFNYEFLQGLLAGQRIGKLFVVDHSAAPEFQNTVSEQHPGSLAFPLRLLVVDDYVRMLVHYYLPNVQVD